MDIDYTVGEVELTYKSTSKSRNKIYSSEDAYEVLLSTYREGTICYKEYFKVLFLNQAKQVLGYTLISEGGITETCADIRVILQAALLTNSVAIILAHNHPSGNLKPSRQDMEITKQVKEAARLMRITVLDHLILTDMKRRDPISRKRPRRNGKCLAFKLGVLIIFTFIISECSFSNQ